MEFAFYSSWPWLCRQRLQPSWFFRNLRTSIVYGTRSFRGRHSRRQHETGAVRWSRTRGLQQQLTTLPPRAGTPSADRRRASAARCLTALPSGAAMCASVAVAIRPAPAATATTAMVLICARANARLVLRRCVARSLRSPVWIHMERVTANTLGPVW